MARSSTPTVIASLLVLVVLAGGAARARAGFLSVNAGCADGSHVVVDWTFYEDPGHPAGHPEWVGYDVLRRTVADCGTYVRVNDQPYARIPGVTQSLSFTEPAPASGVTFQYRVVPVDANRQPVVLEPAACTPCTGYAWTSCPELSAPVTQGTLTDLGWALAIQPCDGSCFYSFYFTGPWADALRPYAGTPAGFRFYGRTACGDIEGCAIEVDHVDALDCTVVTPAARTTWGRVKVIYR